MLLFLMLLGLASLIELGLIWRLRRLLASIVIIVLAVASGGLLASQANVLALLVFVASGFRIFNMLRVIENRLPEPQLRSSSYKTSLWLIAYQAVILLAGLMIGHYQITSGALWNAVTGLQLVIAVLLLLSVSRSVNKTKIQPNKKHFSDNELPTVTVAVPARNEDAQLDDSLQAILASDYPKLEVIVLDDCSHDRTPEIIRKFAHDGARFVGGVPPEDGWLAKNYAYQKLLDEASGDIILFCGVDMRFERPTIRQLVTTMLVRDKKCISVLPLNIIQRTFLIIKPMRYFWELALPRRQLNRPPVLSSCWLIYRDTITKLGGFAAVRKDIVPEAYFAKATMNDHDGYSFLRSSDALGLTSAKPISEELATATRVRYPQLHRRPEMVYLVSLAELFFLVIPFIIAITGYIYSIGLLAETSAILASLILIAVNITLLRATFPKHDLQALASLPLAVMVDVALVNYSMFKYEFSEVIWKQRNICSPSLQVIAQLPDIESRKN